MIFLTDMHTHTYPASHDAAGTLKEMLFHAQKVGVAFYGLSNHVDYDCDFSRLTAEERAKFTNGDEETFFHEARHLQEDYEGVMNVAVGAEFGYSDDEKVQARYRAFYDKFHPDFVVNSVHSYEARDYATREFTMPEEETLEIYLKQIRRSLDAPYPYDIVGHIEYIVRYMPYGERKISLEKYGGLVDDILLAIIQKGKILEVNSATKDLPRISLPSEEIVRRYYGLGGRRISFGSDAHFPARIGDKRAEIMEMLKKIGFTYLTVPFKGEYIKVEI